MTARRALFALAFGVVVAREPIASAQTFEDVTTRLGLDFAATKDGGLVLADFNADGQLDVLMNGSAVSQLYFSNAAGTYQNVTMSNAPALLLAPGERSALAGDFNNDGWVDFARNSSDRVEVYLNGGPPELRFGSATADTPSWWLTAVMEPGAVVDATMNPEGMGILDYDNDGLLDIVFENGSDLTILQSTGDSTIIEIVDPGMIGLANGRAGTPVSADYIAVTDFDVDGFVDVYHRADGLFPEMYANDGDGTFTALGAPTLSAPNLNKGGVAFCDVDADGDFDFFYSDGVLPDANRLYVQTSPRVFTEDTSFVPVVTNVDDIACGDLDNDGDLDVWLSQAGPDAIYTNDIVDGVPSFTRLADTFDTGDGEGVVLADYDQDGLLDVFLNQLGLVTYGAMDEVLTRTAGPNAVLRNTSMGGGYVMVRVLADLAASCGAAPLRRDDIGAVIELADTGRTWSSGVREVNGGQGHGCQGPPLVHFGLPMGAGPDFVLTVRFQYGGAPNARLLVTPSALTGYRVIEVLTSDADGDGIPTSVEQTQATVPDPDGDGYEAWNDVDADGDGMGDAVEAGADACAPADADENGTPDYLEVPAGFDGGVVVVDGGGMGTDGGVTPMDGGPAQIVAHGSGCARCTAGGERDASGAPHALVAMLLVALRAASRRRPDPGRRAGASRAPARSTLRSTR